MKTPEKLAIIRERVFRLENKCFERGFLTPGETALFLAFLKAIKEFDETEERVHTRRNRHRT